MIVGGRGGEGEGWMDREIGERGGWKREFSLSNPFL